MPLPKLSPSYLITDEICSYGCEQQAAYAFNNGKFCCSRTSNQCLSMKLINSKGISRAHKAGKFKNRKIDYDKVALTLIKTANARIMEAEFSVLGMSRKRKRVIMEQDRTCISCGLSKWLDQAIVFELDHVDGNTENNERCNLRALCPNCHSMTPTWRRKKSAL